MKLIEPNVKLIRLDPIKTIELAGRTCYRSTHKIECQYIGDCPATKPLKCDTGECSYSTAPRFVKMLIKRGHEAMLEHGSATFEFTTNRAISHELVRHRLCSFAQESTRYVKYDDIECIKPIWWGNHYENCEDIFFETCLNAENVYRGLIEDGMPPEFARDVLPNALATRIVVTANYRQWRHMLRLRLLDSTGPAHPEIKKLMKMVYNVLHDEVPSIVYDITEELTNI